MQTVQALNWQNIDMKTGKSSAVSSNGNFYFQLCLTAPRQSGRIALTLASWDESQSAAVAKKGERVAATVTVTSNTGRPASNAIIKIMRGDAKTRQGGAYTANGGDDITLYNIQPGNISSTGLPLTDKYYYVTTNAQGQATFDVAQDKSAGLKTPIDVALAEDSTVTDSKEVIFTVITSPDTPDAKMWGHMPETVTGAGGIEFHRPLLAVEAPSTSGNSSYTVANEKWSSVTMKNMQKTGATACDGNYQPRYSDLQALYDAYPDGALATTYGWPIGESNNYWWASDIDETANKWQTINLSNGDKHNSTSSTQTYRQACLVKAHP